jgi:Gpi18-like mannosyltransferase
MFKDIKKHVFLYVCFIFFILGVFFYLYLNKMPVTHPGNLKSSDSFYHIMMIEGILDTGRWNYYDNHIALGQEKALNSQPPLFYINSAILTLFSSVPAWATFYFLICISQGLFILLTYLITKELFDEEKTAILATSLSVLPFPVSVWLYTTYIGIWIQLAGYLFVMAFFWLFLKFMKKKHDWLLIFMGLCLSSITLLHPQDLIF